MSVSDRRLDLLVDDAELDARRAAQPVVERPAQRGYAALYRREVLQAEHGCDFSFLTALTANSAGVGRDSDPAPIDGTA